jgi:hypothetical protein
MDDEEIFQIEELEARLEMQPLPSMVYSACNSDCHDSPPDPVGDY